MRLPPIIEKRRAENTGIIQEKVALLLKWLRKGLYIEQFLA